jgi:2-polyprenyl-6-methoxyphenol hydroxylase-like FAD-dependent oxidoreductase
MKIAAETPVVILGAGLGGLTLAIALRQAGLPSLVLERQPNLSELGAGITLWENAIKVLEHLGVLDEVLKVALPSSSGVIGTASGITLVRASLGSAEAPLGRFIAAHRAELQAALYQALPDSVVRFAVSVQEFTVQDEQVHLTLTDGTQLVTPLLVGADGLRSRTRDQLFGPAPLRYAGYSAYRGVCKNPASRKGPSGEFFGRGDRFGVVAIPNDRLYWYAVVPGPEGTPRAPDAGAMLRKRFRDYSWGVPGILEATGEENILYHELFDRIPTGHFFSGPVALLGDAAHPTTPNMGQGAAMAMESALVLARALSVKKSVQEALATYQTLRAPRTARITKTSLQVGQVAQLSSPILAGLRNLAFRMMPEKVRLSQLEWVANYDAGRAL